MKQANRLLDYALYLIILIALCIAPTSMTRAEALSGASPAGLMQPRERILETTSQAINTPTFLEVFQQENKLSANIDFEAFGYSTAISGDTLVIGIYNPPQFAGYVYIRKRFRSGASRCAEWQSLGTGEEAGC